MSKERQARRQGIKSQVKKILRKALSDLDQVRKQTNENKDWPLTVEAAYVGVARVLTETQLRFKVERFNAGGGSDN